LTHCMRWRMLRAVLLRFPLPNTMIHINHIAMATQNLYEAVFRLRAETGFGFYNGGWSHAGTGSMIVPLGDGAYLQVSSLVDPFALDKPDNSGARRTYDQVANGDVFESLNLRVDTLDELAQIGAKFGAKPAGNENNGRIQMNGERIGAVGLQPAASLPPHVPNVYFFPEMFHHPSGQPVETAFGLVEPLGISWVELGGVEAQVTALLGDSARSLPLRFTGKPNGVSAVAVKTANKEVVIRRGSIATV